MMQNRTTLASQVPAGGVWVELGVAAGTFALEVLQARPDLRYVGVDRWSDHHDVAEMRRARKKLRAFPQAVLCRNTFEEAARAMPEDSCDAVYVDGYAHTGQDGGRTLDLWWPKVKRGGFLCGHDFDAEKWPHTFKAVTYFAGHRGLRVEVIDEPGGFASWRIWRPLQDPVLLAGDCVLVGNGPSLLGSGLGARIDAFPEVVRFNDYKLAGFESDVGAKTTLWSCYGANAQRQRPDPPTRVICLHGAKSGPDWYEPAELWRVPVAFYDRVRADVRTASKLSAEQKERLLPSAGLVTLCWLLEYHRASRVALAGFDHFSREGIGVKHHYWLSGRFTAPQEHDAEAERVLFEELLGDGRCFRL